MGDVLSGVRVLDFGRYIAGPYCAMLLGDFGADVIRIEKRNGGEDRFQAPLTAAQDGGLFMQMNRNKRGMTLDPMTPEGQEVVRRLVGTADVVVANLPPQTLAAMRLDYDSLAAIKPDIILTLVTAYGRGGPYSDRVGFDGIGQVMSGAAYMTSDADGERPYRFQAAWVDFGTALHCAYGTAMALMAKRQTGRGQVVEGALLATALTVGNSLLIEQEVLGIDREPTGNRGQTAGPVDIFRTRDGWMLVQVVGQPLFRRWANLMGEDHWLTDPRFKDDISRGEHGALISARMGAWCAERTSAEALGYPRQGEHPGRPGAEAPAGARRPARQGDGDSSSGWTTPASRAQRRWPARRRGFRRRPAPSASGRRRSASTPTPSWPRSAMPTRRSPHCANAA